MSKAKLTEAEAAARRAWHVFYDANRKMMVRERIPRNPDVIYRTQGWRGWVDWVGPRNMKDINGARKKANG